ncbi:MAG: ComEC/Rec2 family competence protein [Candidatus Falkowbacteria bacterium]|nr:ComEC/Rec2 family competence protein [Candidatus Falkowbacteria bacterium]
MLLSFSRSKLFLFCLICFIAGIGLASFLPSRFLDKDLNWFIAVLFLLAIVIFFRNDKKILIASLGGLFFIFGIWHYAISLPVWSPDQIAFYNGQSVILQGIVSSEPDIRIDKQSLDIKVVSKSGISQRVAGEVLVTTNLYPTFNYGDKLQISCDLQAPEQFNNFAYDRYLARFGIYSVCYYPPIRKLESDQGNWFYAAIYNLKNVIRDKINTNLNEPQASLAAGILLGDMRGAGEDMRLAFSHSGLSHLTAVSGMNVSIIAAVSIFTFLFLGLGRRGAYYLSIIVIVIFIILVGLPASAVRAGVMGFLALTALAFGRMNRLVNALVLAAAILLLANPKLLRTDVGFQLSFLAVLGIIYVYPLLAGMFGKLKSLVARSAADALMVTVSAQIFTLPIIAYNFSIASLVAPLANLLVLWCIAFLTVGLMIALLVSFLLPAASFWIFLPLDLLLRYIAWVAEYTSRLPHAYLEISYLWPGWLIIYYLVVGWLIFYCRQRQKLR